MGNKTLHVSRNESPEVEHEEGELVIVATDEDLQELEQLRAEKKARIAADEAEAEHLKVMASQITMNVPPSAGKGIQMNGVLYSHGRTYSVDNNTKWALEEQSNRLWAHESSLKESEHKGRAKRRAYVG